jgi:CRISPR-associated protein Cas1
LLSFGYSLLTRETLAAVYLVGLDPYLGFFHAIDYGRPSLALDLMEEFRPVVVDRLVIRVLNESLINLSDFEQASVPVSANGSTAVAPEPAKPVLAWRLKPAARNRFLELYEQEMGRYVPYEPERRQHIMRRVIELQVRQVARLILGETGQYQSFLWQ